MTTRNPENEPSNLDQSIDRLQLTLRTAGVLKQHEITTIGRLARTTERDLADIGLTRQARCEIRDVLASRGL